MKTELVISRLKGTIAVCEDSDGDAVEIERSELPNEAKTGDVIVVENGKYSINAVATTMRKEKIEKPAENGRHGMTSPVVRDMPEEDTIE